MTDKKTGLLFPKAALPPKKTHLKKSRKKTSVETALKNIQEAKDRQTRLKIIAGMANSKEPWVCEVLIQALDDPIEDIRTTIITELSNRE